MSKTAGEKLYDKERPKDRVIPKTYVAYKDLPKAMKDHWVDKAKGMKKSDA